MARHRLQRTVAEHQRDHGVRSTDTLGGARSDALRRASAIPAAAARTLARRVGDQRARGIMAGVGGGGASLQPRLAINTPGDAYEREADRMADAVMRSAAPAGGARAGGVSLRRCSCGGTCAACRAREEAELHRDETGARAETPGFAPPLVHDVLASSGRPLAPGTRAFMEPRFGRSFGGVRVHDDARAVESARAVDAHAYAVGSDIVFGAGRYAPGTAAGDRLLAHELAHVVQQGGAGASPGVGVQRADVLSRQATPTTTPGSTTTAAPTAGTTPTSTAAPPSLTVHNTELGGLSVGNFDFHFKDCQILVWVWVKFQFEDSIAAADQTAFKKRFFSAINGFWGNTGWELAGSPGCPCPRVPIRITAAETPGDSYHKLVDVEAAPRRGDVISDMNLSLGMSDRRIRHEFGHVLGLYDEYDGGFFENAMFWHRNTTDTKALMNRGSELRERYFEHYRAQVQETAGAGCTYTITAPTPPGP